jgi:GTP-binding protein HflX
MIRVYNKIDRIEREARVQRDESGMATRVFVSARLGTGVDALQEAVCERLAGKRVCNWIRLAGKDARLRARFFEMGAVSEEKIAEDGAWLLLIDLPKNQAERMAGQSGELGDVIREQLMDAEKGKTPACAA